MRWGSVRRLLCHGAEKQRLQAGPVDCTGAGSHSMDRHASQRREVRGEDVTARPSLQAATPSRLATCWSLEKLWEQIATKSMLRGTFKSAKANSPFSFVFMPLLASYQGLVGIQRTPGITACWECRPTPPAALRSRSASRRTTCLRPKLANLHDCRGVIRMHKA